MTIIEKWRNKIQNDRYDWADKEINAVRLMIAVQRGAVLLGKDHVKIIKNYEQPK